MSRRTLFCHPKTQCDAILSVSAQLHKSDDARLLFTYRIEGQVQKVLVPPLSEAGRADELWQHTCFEAFIGMSRHDGYYEFNFSPSGKWAAYRFTSYRSQGTVANEISQPQMDLQRDENHLQLDVGIDLSKCALLYETNPSTPLRLGLSAVIEESSGHKSYWALAHPGEKPDFHHIGSFFELTDLLS